MKQEGVHTSCPGDTEEEGRVSDELVVLPSLPRREL